ncbi:RRQRL motif-containing zinc-binding protein [Streptomyces flavidovirens]|uniref:RRQRL motif-containing zinc-binding protein n=1 Tax=Streptomyces flavidovirens TaxID=67298 RepID=UPI000688B010|nr:RRQRL motif-containing zinc-binding protein [Streptomyces flavidovirens]
MASRLHDPDGTRYGIPTFGWRLAPEDYATRRQLRARGLRPGGQDVAAQVLWYSRRYWRKGKSPIRVAYLYRIDHAKPVRPMTPAKWAALAKANAAQRVCPECRRDAGYRIPTSLGMCTTCAYSQDQCAA